MHLSLGITVALLAATPALADTVTLPFPAQGADWLSQGNNETGELGIDGGTQFMWVAGDYVRESFADTGLASAAGISGTFDITNALGQDLLVDVLVNGTTAGQLTIAQCDICFEVQTISYSFAFAPVVGDDYDLEYRLANTIETNFGSMNFLVGGSVTLTDEVAPIVPEPASWATMIAGLGLVGGALRSRPRRVAAAG